MATASWPAKNSCRPHRLLLHRHVAAKAMIVPHLLKVSVAPAADPELVAQTRRLPVLPGEIPGNGDRADHKLEVSDRANLAQADHLRAAHLKVGNAVPVVLADRIVAAHRKVDHKMDLHRVDRARILLASSIMSSSSTPTVME